MTNPQGMRWKIEWQPSLEVELAAQAKGYTEESGLSYWDFIDPGDEIQKKFFTTKTAAFQAAKNRVRIDLFGEVRLYQQEEITYQDGRKGWRTIGYWLIYKNTKKIDW